MMIVGCSSVRRTPRCSSARGSLRAADVSPSLLVDDTEEEDATHTVITMRAWG